LTDATDMLLNVSS